MVLTYADMTKQRPNAMHAQIERDDMRRIISSLVESYMSLKGKEDYTAAANLAQRLARIHNKQWPDALIDLADL